MMGAAMDRARRVQKTGLAYCIKGAIISPKMDSIQITPDMESLQSLHVSTISLTKLPNHNLVVSEFFGSGPTEDRVPLSNLEQSRK